MTTLLLVITLLANPWSFPPRQPHCPYQAPDNLFKVKLPVDSATQKLIAEHRIEQTIIYETAFSKTVHHFNPTGLLQRTENVHVISDTSEAVVETTTYNYNTDGLVLEEKYVYEDYLSGQYEEVTKVFTYKQTGQIETFLYTSVLQLPSNEREPSANYSDTIFDMQMVRSFEASYDLYDKVSNSTYTLSLDNRILKNSSKNLSDSISVEYLDNSKTEKFWYREKGDLHFKLGQQLQYVDGLLRSKTVWDKCMHADGRNAHTPYSETFYGYDCGGKLLRSECFLDGYSQVAKNQPLAETRLNSRIYISYNHAGLVTQHLIEEPGRTPRVVKYEYVKRK